MKSNCSIFSLIAGTLIMLASCTEKSNIPSPGDNSHNIDTMYVAPDPTPDPDPKGIDIPAEAINVNEAYKIGTGLKSGASTDSVYYIKGWITSTEDNTSGIAGYGNASFHMAATRMGSNKEFYAFQVLGKDGQKLIDVSQVEVGDFVVVKGKITNYGGTIETQSKGAAHIYSSTNPMFDPADPDPTPAPEGVQIPEGTLNVYEAVKLGQDLGSGKTSNEEYYVMGYVSRLDNKHASAMADYGNGVFYIAANKDGMHTKEFEAYQVYGKNGKKFTNTDAVQVGDFVIIKGKITNYNGTIETTGKGSSYVYYSTNPNW